MSNGGMHLNLTPGPFPGKEGEPCKHRTLAAFRVDRVPQLIALGALHLYRLTVSPLIFAVFGPACRFEPSCSRFATDAIREHGLMGGGAMALRRLARCHPLGGHGYDPVPAKRP